MKIRTQTQPTPGARYVAPGQKSAIAKEARAFLAALQEAAAVAEGREARRLRQLARCAQQAIEAGDYERATAIICGGAQ